MSSILPYIAPSKLAAMQYSNITYLLLFLIYKKKDEDIVFESLKTINLFSFNFLSTINCINYLKSRRFPCCLLISMFLVHTVQILSIIWNQRRFPCFWFTLYDDIFLYIFSLLVFCNTVLFILLLIYRNCLILIVVGKPKCFILNKKRYNKPC